MSLAEILLYVVLGIALGTSLSSIYLTFRLFHTVHHWIDRVIPIVVEWETLKKVRDQRRINREQREKNHDKLQDDQ
jgi:hypothetical protein